MAGRTPAGGMKSGSAEDVWTAKWTKDLVTGMMGRSTGGHLSRE